MKVQRLTTPCKIWLGLVLGFIEWCMIFSNNGFPRNTCQVLSSDTSSNTVAVNLNIISLVAIRISGRFTQTHSNDRLKASLILSHSSTFHYFTTRLSHDLLRAHSTNASGLSVSSTRAPINHLQCASASSKAFDHDSYHRSRILVPGPSALKSPGILPIAQSHDVSASSESTGHS